MWHSARASTGSDRSRLQPPSLVRVAFSAQSRLSASKPTSQLGVERVPLAGHRDVLGAVEPQQDRPAGERRAQRRDGGEAVRLHLLAAEPAAHPQALHGDVVAGQAQHVRDDLLGLRRVLGAGLDEDLPVLVDQGQRGVGLQVEVLLPAELELAGERVRGRRRARRRRRRGRRCAGVPWKLSASMASVSVRATAAARTRPRWRRRPAGRRPAVSPSTQHDGVAVEHHLAGEQRFVVLDRRRRSPPARRRRSAPGRRPAPRRRARRSAG